MRAGLWFTFRSECPVSSGETSVSSLQGLRPAALGASTLQERPVSLTGRIAGAARGGKQFPDEIL